MISFFKSLKFQTLSPIVILFVLTASFSVLVLSTVQRKLTTTEKQSMQNSKMSRAVIEFNQIRSLYKSDLLLYILTWNERYRKNIIDLEDKRKEKETLLIHALANHPYYQKEREIDQFIRSFEYTKKLREMIVDSVQTKKIEKAMQSFETYSTLFEINSARLLDITNRLESELAQSKKSTTELYHLLIALAVALLIAGTFFISFTLRFYQKNLLYPIEALKNGLRNLNDGIFTQLERNKTSTIEMETMVEDFNRASKALEVAKDQLLEANHVALQSAKVKSEFLSNMSHEIRTPLNSIIGLSELLLEQEKSEQEYQSYLHAISSSSKHLLHIVNDILDLTKLESGEMILDETPCDLKKIIEQIQLGLTHSFLEKSIQFKVFVDSSVPQYVLIDELKIEQILMNLLSNAKKFTDHGSVELNLSVIKKSQKEYIEFRVTDTGIGISEENLKKLFTRFSQADNSITKKYGGTGLGLAIVKQLADLMHGWIETKSSVNQGSVFSVYIPLRRSNQVESKTEKNPLDHYQNKLHMPLKILLVDDSKENRFIVKAFLKNYPYEIHEAVSGSQAIHFFENQNYDLVLMDIQMPDMDGITATKEIRKIEKSKNKKETPIFALSAFALPEEKKRSQDAGCDLHLTKPIQKQILLEAIAVHTTS